MSNKDIILETFKSESKFPLFVELKNAYERIAELEGALQYLISVKEHKDRDGKTEWYEYHKELAWKQAKTVLKG